MPLPPPFISDVADVRQHLLSEQFERFHQLVRMFRARGLERQVDDAGADLLAALFNCATISSGPPQKLMGSTRLTLAGRRPSPATLRWSSSNSMAATPSVSGNSASRGYCAKACCAFSPVSAIRMLAR